MEKVYEVIAAFDAASNHKEYSAAKKLCAKSFDALGQLAFVDAARAARRRIGGAA